VLAVLLVLALIVYGLVSGGKEVDDRTAGLGESSLTEGADEHDHPGGCQVQCPARLLAVTCSPVWGSSDTTSTARSSIAAMPRASTAQFARTVGPSKIRTRCAVGPAANGTHR